MINYIANAVTSWPMWLQFPAVLLALLPLASAGAVVLTWLIDAADNALIALSPKRRQTPAASRVSEVRGGGASSGRD